MDCDSKGYGFNSHYSPMFEIYTKLEKKYILLNSIHNINTFFYPINIKKKIFKKKIFKIKKLVSKKSNTIYLSIFKPKYQFFFSLFFNKNFFYSTGLIIKSLGLQNKNTRRSKIGYNLFFSFLLKKLEHLKILQYSKIFFFLKNLNNYNSIKKFLLKYAVLWNFFFTFLIKVGKNYNLKKYKKISYINKRMRKRYIIE